MLKSLTNVNVWVQDQDEALAFYTEKLGLELRNDVTVPEMGNFRWLTVGVPGQEDVAIVLMAVPGPPVFDEETSSKLKDLVAKGAAGGLFFAADDIDATYQELLVNTQDVLKQHVWIVDIDGTPVTITVTSKTGASVADLAEGNAIVDSIRVERTATRSGFRLTFALQTGWDSG